MQQIGNIDSGSQNALKERINISVGSVSGAGQGLVGAGKVEQNIGVISAGGGNNLIDIQAATISGTGRGILGRGTSVEKIGVIVGANADNTVVKVTARDIKSSAEGSGSMAEIDIGVISGGKARNQTLKLSTGNVTAESIGINAESKVLIGTIDSNSQVTSTIKVGDVENKVFAVDSSAVIEIGHVYANVKKTCDHQHSNR